jgi:RES domain-containing protein
LSRFAWRIATDTPDYTADDLTGTGAKLSGGRWNRAGTAMVYCSANIALACLETFVHLKSLGGLPLNRYLVRIEIPDSVWDKGVKLTAETAPVGWDAEPTGKVSLDEGDKWAGANRSAIMMVPSVIVPDEHNVLLNPLHPDARKITAQKIRKWVYDSRMI